MVVVAGTPGSGKTSVLMHAVKDLVRAGHAPALVKIDCMWTEDDARFKRLKVPVAVGLSKDMCPDHYAIYNFDEMLEWAAAQGADIMLNETAGLCLRCAPYPDKALAICVIDGNLVTDPYYLRPLLNLSSNWLGETYTDPDTGFPMETYSDPLTGKKIYRFLSPTTSKPFFTYSTYPDAKTGNLVYAYVDPMTGKEVYASSAPIDIINALAGKMADQTAYNQNEPWTRL
jgi:RecA/RadA recombinase